MSDRWVFLTSFLTAVFIVAGAFTSPQLFYFDLARSTIFVAIAVLVFFGDDLYSYMLAIIFPVIWFAVDLLMGVFFSDFRELFDYFEQKTARPLESPLHAFARVGAVLLFITAMRARRREVTERFWGRTFWISLAVCAAYVGILSFWYIEIFPS